MVKVNARAIRTCIGMFACPKTGAKSNMPPTRKKTIIKNGILFIKVKKYSISPHWQYFVKSPNKFMV